MTARLRPPVDVSPSEHKHGDWIVDDSKCPWRCRDPRRRTVDPRWVTASGALLDEVLDQIPSDDVEVRWSLTDVGPEPHDYREDGPRGIRFSVTALAIRP